MKFGKGVLTFLTKETRVKFNVHKTIQNAKMALIFRWYLGLSSNWANKGVKERLTDMQIWCGPSMGAFNDWAKGSYLEAYQNREAADIALHIMEGAAYLYRVQALKNAREYIWDNDLANYQLSAPIASLRV